MQLREAAVLLRPFAAGSDPSGGGELDRFTEKESTVTISSVAVAACAVAMNSLGPLSTLVSLLLGVCMLPTALVLLALRAVYDALNRALYSAPGFEPMHAKDSVWQPKADPHMGVQALIVALVEIDRCTLTQLRELVRVALVEKRGIDGALMYPRFSQRAVRRGPFGAWFWESERAFDVRDHVVAAPADARSPKGRMARLEALSSGTVGVGVALDSALWHFELIEEPDGPVDPLRQPLATMHLVKSEAPRKNASSILLVQTHHSMADGAALVDVLTHALSKPVQRPQAPAGEPPTPEPGHASAPLSKLGVGGFTLGRAVQAAVELPLLVLSRLLASKDRNAFRGPISTKKRLAVSRSVPLAAVKELAAAAGTSVNAVILASAALALRDRLIERGAAVPREMTAVAPVVTRARSQRIRMENELGVVFVAIAVGLGAEPRALLSHAAAQLAELKAGVVSHAMVLTLRLVHALLPECASVLLLAFTSDKATLLFSTLPGPNVPIVWDAGGGEYRVHESQFWAPVRSGVAVSISSFTYRGLLSMSVLTDEGVEGQPQAIADRFAPALDALRTAHGLPPVASADLDV